MKSVSCNIFSSREKCAVLRKMFSGLSTALPRPGASFFFWMRNDRKTLVVIKVYNALVVGRGTGAVVGSI